MQYKSYLGGAAVTNYNELKFKQMETAVKRGDLIAIENLGQRIKNIREALGMTQAQLARRAKIGQSALSRLEEDISKSSLATVLKLVRALGCNFMGAITAERTLGQILSKQAEGAAKKILDRTIANMAMEEQGSNKSSYNYQLKKLVDEFMENPGPELWED